MQVVLSDSLIAAAPGWRLLMWKLPAVSHNDALSAADIDDAPDHALTYTAPIAAWVLRHTNDDYQFPYLLAAIPQDYPQQMVVEPDDHVYRLAYLAPGEDVGVDDAAEARRRALAWLERAQ